MGAVCNHRTGVRSAVGALTITLVLDSEQAPASLPTEGLVA